MLCTEVESLQEVVKQVERRQDGIGSVARAGDDHLQFRPYCIFVSLCFQSRCSAFEDSTHQDLRASWLE